MDSIKIEFDANLYVDKIQQIKPLYTEYISQMLVCFTTGQSDNKEFIKLRDNVVIDSLTYHTFIVPFVQETLQKIIAVFDLFDDKGYKNPQEFLEDIEQFQIDIKEIQERLVKIVNIHVQVSAMAQTRQIFASEIIEVLKSQNQTRRNQIESLEQKIKEGGSNQIAEMIQEALDKTIPVVGLIGTAFKFLVSLFGPSNEDSIQEKNILKAEINTNDICLITLEQNLLPAINNYVAVMDFLLKVFTAMQTDADAIKNQSSSMKEMPKRCNMFFAHLKENADRLKKVSKELIYFYKSAESQFVAMKNLKGKLSFVGKWKEFLRYEKESLLSKVMTWLGSQVNNLIDHDL